ncbi:hypothetical protein B0T19DRAFT_403871 [Cercophora scortea]|uniref:C2H2-type domain-containing protein n=1 Tax=Cercophora scortea TaxID=314031 RepID=A0AAE0M7E2_9PEZI|nr:hypothetical protein B0T19DRAFT_403871 [Cercophora scortea]
MAMPLAPTVMRTRGLPRLWFAAAKCFNSPRLPHKFTRSRIPTSEIFPQTLRGEYTRLSGLTTILVMEDHTTPTETGPTSAGHHESSLTARDLTRGVCATEAPAMAAPSNKPAQIPVQGRESLHKDNDVEVQQGVERSDSIDSYRSNFRRKHIDSFWSVDSTTSTAPSEIAPSSPEYAAVNDVPFDDRISLNDTSAARHPFILPHRGLTFQSPPPSRTSSIGIADLDNARYMKSGSPPEKSHLIRHPHRLQEMGPRRGSFPRHFGIDHSHRSNTGSAPGSRRGSNQSIPTPHLGAVAGDSKPRSNLARILDDAEGRSPSPLESPGSPATDKPQVKNEDEDTLVFDTLQDAEPVCEEADASSTYSDAGDSDALSTHRPDDKLVQDVCDHILKHVFGVEVQDLTLTDAVSAAYNSVSYCLNELSNVVPASNLANSGPSVHELPSRSTAPSTPIRPSASGTDSGAGAGGGSGSGNGSGSGSGRAQKRSNDGNDPGRGADGGDDPGDRAPGGGKRQKTAAPTPPAPDDQKLSCPFRKRNPVKFNVRDFQSCAVQCFPDISQLKRHVKNFHKQKAVSAFACPRCKQDTKSKEGYDNHLNVPSGQICEPKEPQRSRDPEDGITSVIEDLLNGRKASTKIDGWEALWYILFPNDVFVPVSDFVPPIELEEVQAEFRAQGCRELRKRIRDEDLKFAGSDEDATERIVNMCEKYVDFVFKACRDKTGDLPGRPRKRRVQANSLTLTTTSGDQRFLTPPQMIPSNHRGGNASGSNESSLSSSIDTPNSTHSWANFGQTVVQTQISQGVSNLEGKPGSSLEDLTPTAAGDHYAAGLVVTSANAVSPVRMTQAPPVTQGHQGLVSVPPPHTTIGLAGLHRPQMSSEDSGVGMGYGMESQSFPDPHPFHFLGFYPEPQIPLQLNPQPEARHPVMQSQMHSPTGQAIGTSAMDPRYATYTHPSFGPPMDGSNLYKGYYRQPEMDDDGNAGI